MIKSSPKKFVLISFVLLLTQLIFLFFVKYHNQDISLGRFSFANIGNIFNLLIYVGLISGIYFSARKKNSEVSTKAVFNFIVLTWTLLIVAFFSTKLKIISDTNYIFNQPGDKVLTGVLFLIFLLAKFNFMIFIWSRLSGKHNPSTIRNLFSTMLMLILLLIFTFVYINNINYSSGNWVLKKDKNNTAVVLGAAVWSGNTPSPTLASRVDKALALFKKGFIGKIVLTGGKAPGELTESEVAFEYARIKGADTSIIIIEKYTSSTTAQIKWIEQNLLQKELSKGDIIIISDGYHLPRVIEISKFYNLDLKVTDSLHKLYFKDRLYNYIRESIALFNFWNFAL